MTIDLPPQVPPAIIEYITEHDYLPDEYLNLNEENMADFINKCNETYNGYKIYRLGYVGDIDKEHVGYKYKNCYLLLSNPNETRCSTPEEETDIIQHYPNLYPIYLNDIPKEVIKFVRIYGATPDHYKIEYKDFIDDFISRSYSEYNDYEYFYLGFPNGYKYTPDRCQIVLHNKKETRCATEDEYNDIMIIRYYYSDRATLIYGDYLSKNNYFIDKYLGKETLDKFNNKDYITRYWIDIVDSYKKYKGHSVIFVSFIDAEKPRDKSDVYVILLSKWGKIRCAKEKEFKEIMDTLYETKNGYL